MNAFVVKMTEEQREWLVTLLDAEADPCAAGAHRDEDSEDWLNMQPGTKQINALGLELAHAKPAEFALVLPRWVRSPEQIEEARDDYQCDTTKIDDDALVSPAEDEEGGYWVSAWVWIEGEEGE